MKPENNSNIFDEQAAVPSGGPLSFEELMERELAKEQEPESNQEIKKHTTESLIEPLPSNFVNDFFKYTQRHDDNIYNEANNESAPTEIEQDDDNTYSSQQSSSESSELENEYPNVTGDNFSYTKTENSPQQNEAPVRTPNNRVFSVESETNSDIKDQKHNSTENFKFKDVKEENVLLSDDDNPTNFNSSSYEKISPNFRNYETHVTDQVSHSKLPKPTDSYQNYDEPKFFNKKDYDIENSDENESKAEEEDESESEREDSEETSNSSTEDGVSSLVNRYFFAPQRKKKQKIPKKKTAKEKQEILDKQIEEIGLKKQELEEEIKQFRAEKEKLKRISAERQRDLQRIQKEKEEIAKQKENAQKEIEQMKQDELKKMKKERRVWERQAKAVANVANKKDKEEIEKLKNEISELKKRYKIQDSKRKAAIDRLSNRVNELTKNNQELQDELKEKELERLDLYFDRKRKQSNNNIQTKQTTKRSKPKVISYEQESFQPEDENNDENQQEEQSTFDNDNQITTEIPIDDDNSNYNNTENVTENNFSDEEIDNEEKNDEFIESPDTSCAVLPEDVIQNLGEDEDILVDQRLFEDGKILRKFKSGKKIIEFPNGTRKAIWLDGSACVIFSNGDVKNVTSDGCIVYLYASANTTQTTYPNGLQVYRFDNGQVEKHFPNGDKEIIFVDDTLKRILVDGTQEIQFPDGMLTIHYPNGEIIERKRKK